MQEPPLFDDLIWVETAKKRDLHAFTHRIFLGEVWDFSDLRRCLQFEVPLAEADSSNWLHGHVRGRELILRRHGHTTGAAIEVALDPPLRLALRMRSSGQPGTIGAPTLSDMFSIQSLDGRLAKALFEATEEGRALAARLLARPLLFPHFADGVLGISMFAMPEGSAHFLEHIDLALDLADELQAARRALPPSAAEQALERSFKTVAKRLAGSFDPVRVELSAEVDGVPVEAAAPVREQSLHTVVRARLDPPLGLGLRVGKEQRLATLRALIGRGDITTGDRPFDAAFHIAGAPKESVVAALSEVARRGLLDARARGAESLIDDDRVELDYARAPRSADDLLERLGEVAAIARALRAQPSARSPYR
jgi:hypothetical protein